MKREPTLKAYLASWEFVVAQLDAIVPCLGSFLLYNSSLAKLSNAMEPSQVNVINPRCKRRQSGEPKEKVRKPWSENTPDSLARWSNRRQRGTGN